MAAPVDPYDSLLSKIQDNFAQTKSAAVASQSAFSLSRVWLDRFDGENPTNPANRLLRASKSASIEAVSAVSMGMARPAIFLLRSHFELFMMFLFYRHHSVELRAAENEVEFMKLPGDIVKYLRKYFLDFDKRWKLLDGKKSRAKTEGYGRLSEIVHGSSLTAAPAGKLPVDVCLSPAELAPIVELIADIAEELSDLAVAAHEGNWMSLPTAVQSNLQVRSLEAPFKALG